MKLLHLTGREAMNDFAPLMESLTESSCTNDYLTVRCILTPLKPVGAVAKEESDGNLEEFITQPMADFGSKSGFGLERLIRGRKGLTAKNSRVM